MLKVHLLSSIFHKGLFTKRHSRVLFGILFFFSAFFFLFKIEDTAFSPWLSWYQKLPPLYERWHEYERRLPQHDLTLPPPEGQSTKFIFMAGHAYGCGWGNALQEMILNAHLAFATKRSFVFYNYTWDRHESEYSDFNGKIIPSRVPVSTMLSGPIIGGPYHAQYSDVPRAVSREYYREVCPEPKVIDSTDIKEKLNGRDGQGLMDGYIEYITAMEDTCIEFSRDSAQLFDIWLFGDDKLLPLFQTLRKSPIITQFGFSPLILSAYATNKQHFVPSSSLSFPGASLTADDSPIIMESKPIPGLLTMHIRRGDFEGHCLHLEQWSSRFTGHNSFPEIIDKLNPEAEDKKSEYSGHCYPTIEEIVKKANDVKRLANKRNNTGDQELKRIYVMSNAPKQWLEELKEAFKNSAQFDGGESWDAIHTSRDLKLSWEQKYVVQSLDMYVAMRSQGFIGNGFSSLTAIIVMMRMASNVDPVYTRLW